MFLSLRSLWPCPLIPPPERRVPGASLNSAAGAAGPGGVPEISRTPAYELLGALDLLNVVPREGLAVGEKTARPDGSYVVRITLGLKPVTAPFAARGLEILQMELANSNAVSLQSFDLLYNSGGSLISVFPVIPEELFNKEPQSKEKWEELQPRYFDLSQYYFEVPRPGSPGELEKWIAFAERCGKDLALISRFAKALPEMLKPEGRSLLWNYAPYADGKNMVAETLKFAGGKEQVFEVETERFLKRKRPKEEYFKGHLYTLSRVR